MASRREHLTPLHRQRGISMVFIGAGMVALLLMVGLALDTGHATLNKARLQNATDAAALAAAKALDSTRNTAIATTEALIAFQANANSTGDQELAAAYANGSGTVQVATQYSATLPPFTAGSPVGPYVRVTATGFTRPTWFMELAGIQQMTVTATAVAGPSPTLNQACNLVPMMVCGNAAAGAAANWGYTVNAPTVMKLASPPGSSVGPGNFQLIQLPGGSGANWVRQNLAGSYGGCPTLGNSITTQPGDETGPVADGLDTRFGVYIGNLQGTQAQYPPDVITTQQSPALTVNTTASGCTASPCIQQGNSGPIITANNIGLIFSYQQYQSELGTPSDYNYPPPSGVEGRRILAVPVGNCSGGSGGSTSIPLLGFACYFLLQQPTHQGNTDWVLGQFISTCDVNGTPGPAPVTGPGPYIIQLYHDPSSGDS